MHYRVRALFILVVSALGIGWLIAACGQKGDLYLPEPEPTQQTVAGTETGTETEAVQQQVEADGKAADGTETGAVRRIEADGEAAEGAGPAAVFEIEQPNQK